MSVRLLVGPVLGAVTAHSARILLETDRDCHVEVQLLSTGHQSRHRARLTACMPKAVVVEGLAPKTEYAAHCTQLGWSCKFTTTGLEGPCSLVPVSCASQLSDRAIREIQEMHTRVPTTLLHLEAPLDLHESVDIDRIFARRGPHTAGSPPPTHSARLAAVLTADPGISTLAQLCIAFCKVHRAKPYLIADLRRILQAAMRFVFTNSASSKLYSRLPSEFLAGFQASTEPMPLGLMWRRVLNLYFAPLCTDGVLIRGSVAVTRSSTNALTPTVTTLLTMATELPQQWRLDQGGRLCLSLSTGTSDSSIDTSSGCQWSHVLVTSTRLLWTTFYHQPNSVQQHKRERFESNLKPGRRFTNVAEKSDRVCGSFTQLVNSLPLGLGTQADRQIQCQDTSDAKRISDTADDKESTFGFQRRVPCLSSPAGGIDCGTLGSNSSLRSPSLPGESAAEDIVEAQVAWSQTYHPAEEPQMRVPLSPVSLGSSDSLRFPSLFGESAAEDIVEAQLRSHK
ncbi:MAG: uncharacterized protein KVP18_003525 [Porospora cf. gigantea A]|uniref:uncharacterized protein n=1 Tax=Porospora cf. gigantea A TaxID=2853593 RepID=UPI00355A2308|nr:MAG: hypothetical protein KVP18_003525 [Porospora cf. gigantea A]